MRGTRTDSTVLDLTWLDDQLSRRPPASVAVLDIDSTIMDTALRNRRILQAAARPFPAIAPVVEAMTDEDLGWGAAELAAQRARLDAAATGRLHRFWAERFFSSPWLAYDRPYPGVAAFLWWLRARDIGLVYLTGRDEPNMRDGTIESFEAHGLPTGRGARFLFKPDAGDDDLAFKREACTGIAGIGSVVLAVENEPANANALRRAFPDATVLLIDTITAPDPAPLDPGVPVFAGYPEEVV